MFMQMCAVWRLADVGGAGLHLPVLIWLVGARGGTPILGGAQVVGNLSGEYLSRREPVWQWLTGSPSEQRDRFAVAIDGVSGADGSCACLSVRHLGSDLLAVRVRLASHSEEELP